MWEKTIELLGLTDTQVKRMRYIIGTGIAAIIGILFFLVQVYIVRKYGDLTELSAYISLSVIIEGICLDITYELFKITKPVPKKIE